MLAKILGQAKMTAMMKKLRGGPQSMLPMSPMKGSGLSSMKGLTPRRGRQYTTPKQNPNRSPMGGLGKAKLI